MNFAERTVIFFKIQKQNLKFTVQNYIQNLKIQYSKFTIQK